MKIPILSSNDSLCDQCVALCCRYYAFAIDNPTTHRDFEDLRWFLLHEDCVLFVEEGQWYLQVNRKCRELLPDNRCGIYENRPSICREYTTEECDWHADEYEYDELFTEPEQIAAYAKEFLAKKQKRKSSKPDKSPKSPGTAKSKKKKVARTGSARKPAPPVHLLKSA